MCTIYILCVRKEKTRKRLWTYVVETKEKDLVVVFFCVKSSTPFVVFFFFHYYIDVIFLKNIIVHIYIVIGPVQLHDW